jgi:hypothetical protein
MKLRNLEGKIKSKYCGLKKWKLNESTSHATFMFKGTQTPHEGPKCREETNGLFM